MSTLKAICVCQICGKEFNKRSGRRRANIFCSQRCSQIASKGRECTWKDKLSASAKGRKLSPETKEKIGAASRGRKWKNEDKFKLCGRVPWNKGKIMSEEFKANASRLKKEYYAALPEEKLKKHMCTVCGCVFRHVVGRTNKFCSKECYITYKRNDIKTRELLLSYAKGNKSKSGTKQSDEFKAAQSKRSLENWQRPEFVQKQRENRLANWQNPEFVKKQMTSRHVTPNKTELNFLDILNSISPQPFKYVGDGQLIVAGKCPDYVCETNDRLLIELYGDYWHRGENPQERINLFAENGYKTLIVWEKELRDTEKLSNNILLFIRS